MLAVRVRDCLNLPRGEDRTVWHEKYTVDSKPRVGVTLAYSNKSIHYHRQCLYEKSSWIGGEINTEREGLAAQAWLE